MAKEQTGEIDLSPEEYLKKRDALLAAWERSRVTLESAKAAEMEQRKAYVIFAFDPTKKSGTETIELANGFKARCIKKLNYNVNQETVNDALDKIENIGGAEGKVISERLIKWKADLSITEYNQLDEKYKKIIDEVITTSEGAPSLEIVPPKDKKRM